MIIPAWPKPTLCSIRCASPVVINTGDSIGFASLLAIFGPKTFRPFMRTVEGHIIGAYQFAFFLGKPSPLAETVYVQTRCPTMILNYEPAT